MNSKRQIFSPQEKSLLINIIKDYKGIEEKKTDNVSLKKKKSLWEEITQLFNSQGIGAKRDKKELKKCWMNSKQKAKQFVDL